MQVALANKLYTAPQPATASLRATAVEEQRGFTDLLCIRTACHCWSWLFDQTAVTDWIAVDFRITDRDMIVGGYRVPKDTPVQLPPYPLHLSSANFVQPHKFWPERWAQQMPAFSPDKGMLLCLGYSNVQVESLPV